jgi:hypothetical protein
MSDFWKLPAILIAVMIVFGAIYLGRSVHTDVADAAAAVSAVSPDDIMRSAGSLPATVIDDYE